MGELLAGLLVALAAVALVLEPLVRGQAGAFAPAEPLDLDLSDPTESDSPKVRALVALKEIEFDRATGKLAEEDYVRLKAKYETQAIEAIRAEEAAAKQAPGPPPDRAEEAIRRVSQARGRACPACGPRPEPNAVFCSTCGRSLMTGRSSARCWICGAALPDGAKYCAACGRAIAA